MFEGDAVGDVDGFSDGWLVGLNEGVSDGADVGKKRWWIGWIKYWSIGRWI